MSDRLPLPSLMEYIRGATYFGCLAEQSRATLIEILCDTEFSGVTDPQTLSFLHMLLANNNYSSVLELGTASGFSAIVIADALKHGALVHHKPLNFDTVELDPANQKRAAEYIRQAGFGDFVRCINGSTLDPAVVQMLRPAYDCIYVDSSHSYDQTGREINEYYPRLMPGGVMLFHDTSPDAAAWDPSRKGGVRRAIDEWRASASPPDEFYFLEKPLWRSICGLFIAGRKNKNC